MKSALQLATQWDGKPVRRAENRSEAVSFFNTIDSTRGKAAQGLGHCLRLIHGVDHMFEAVAPHALDYLNRHGLGRPGLRLLTAHLLATEVEPDTALCIRIGHTLAAILDDPASKEQIKPLLRLQGEEAAIYCLGLHTPRGRTGVINSMMVLNADNSNSAHPIPLDDKREYLEKIENCARALGFGSLADRAASSKRSLERREEGDGNGHPTGAVIRLQDVAGQSTRRDVTRMPRS